MAKVRRIVLTGQTDGQPSENSSKLTRDSTYVISSHSKFVLCKYLLQRISRAPDTSNTIPYNTAISMLTKPCKVSSERMYKSLGVRALTFSLSILMAIKTYATQREGKGEERSRGLGLGLGLVRRSA